MPLQVSYKKQFALMLMLLVTLLVIVEIIVNIWLYNFYRCDFEDNEIFQDVDPEINRTVCLETLAFDFTNTRLTKAEGTFQVNRGGLDENLVSINNHGFRGPEFTEVKAENTYRIFTVGGSTTFGLGVLDDQTWPFYLQEFYDQSDLDFKVEVINAGWPGKWSGSEVILIKKQLLALNPDLFIIYDGANDLLFENKGRRNVSATLWGERWMAICNLGNQLGFDTIISLQPEVTTGKKILTVQEYGYQIMSERKKTLENYPGYIEQLDSLRDTCSLAVDLRSLFDNENTPIFFDRWHTGPEGNNIIAQKFYSLSLPIALKSMENINSTSDSKIISNSETSSRLISNDPLSS